MYPIKFDNLYYEKIWGGRKFEKIRNNLPKGRIGESWDIACHVNGMSIVSNGKYKGVTLDNLIKLEEEKVLGTKISKEKFPLLIKLINAEDTLSIQVHPDDKYAKREGELGKTEAWYVLEADEGAKLILGINPEVSKGEIKRAIENGELENYINEISVEKGEVYFVKSGLIHAIGKGIMIVELQQNSDTTYRVYDYNRGRELHINKALDVIDSKLRGEESKGLIARKFGYDKTYLCLCKEFSLELYEVKTYFKEQSDKDRFYTFTCVEGIGKINYIDKKSQYESLEISKGESILIPAGLGEYVFEGKMKLLKSYVPDIKKVEEEILKEVKR